MKTKNILCVGLLVSALSLSSFAGVEKDEQIMNGPYKATWESLEQYGQAPDWFRDAKFGIWAHWGPQCQPEQGDWYARNMYIEGSWPYKWHVANYGHPSKFGFKDVINLWKADKWNPDSLMALYKKVGAKYFVTLGNHHDNFDLWNSKHHKWNSMNLGPKKDIVGGRQKAAKKTRYVLWCKYPLSPYLVVDGSRATLRQRGRTCRCPI